MSKRFATQIDIDASPAQVWDVLSDMGAYPEWNPFIVAGRRHGGGGQPGHPADAAHRGRAVTLRPTIVEAQPGRRLRWQGRLGVAGVMDVDHCFTIEPRTTAGHDSARTRRSAACWCRSWPGPWTGAPCPGSAP